MPADENYYLPFDFRFGMAQVEQELEYLPELRKETEKQAKDIIEKDSKDSIDAKQESVAKNKEVLLKKEEVEQAVKAGAEPLTLGKRILRTETAGLTMLSVLMFHLEG